MKKGLFEIPIAKIYISGFLLLLLAVALTVGFWFRWYYSVPSLILIGIASFKACRRIHYETQNDSPLQVTAGMLTVIILIPVWLIAVGMGGFIGQEQFDNSYRNAVLYELVCKSWPVTQIVDGQEYYLSYYFTYWLPVALVGKLFHSMEAAYIGLLVYAWIWISLTVMMVIHYCGGRRPFMVGFIILFFLPPIIIDHIIFQNILGWYRFWCAVDPIISGSPTMIYNCTFIYNQTLPIIMAIPLMIRMKRSPGVVAMILAMIFYYGPIETLPLIPVVMILVLKDLKGFRTLELWSAIILTGLISLFYLGNSNGTHFKSITSEDYSLAQVIIMFIAYLVISIGTALPFIWNRVRKNLYFWIILASTLPFIFILPSYGNYDYGWKSPVALMFVLSIEIAYVCSGLKWKNHKFRCTMLGIYICLGIISGYELYLRAARCILPYFNSKYSFEKRAEHRYGKIFEYDRDDPIDSAVSESFITNPPTVYSEYLMPDGVASGTQPSP